MPRRLPTLFAVAAVTLLATSAEAARTLEVSFTPTGAPQIAIWLETADGEFVDTIMVTRKVGTFGLGNRPGRADLGGGFLWPYGRREMTLPVWAHRRNVQYDRIVFQNCREGWLGWHELHSSQEPFYCRPVTPAENDVGVDTVSCPSHNFRSDKGWSVKRAKTDNSPECRHLVEMMPETSLYPPRNDLRNYDPTRDWSGIRDYSDANDLDTVTQATPPGQQRFRVTYQAPDALAARDYVVWVEINEEFDSNDSHNYAMFVDAALPDYGQSSIGQPSVVWKIPVTMGDADAVTAAKAYAGYGSPDGSDGRLRPPDNTITTDTEGSGSGRLVTLDDAALGRHQVRVFYTPDAECPSPPPVTDLQVLSSTFDTIKVRFTSTATSAAQITRYELRYAVGSDAIRTESDFQGALPGPAMVPESPGEVREIEIEPLRPNTKYTVAVRTFNLCQQASSLELINTSTPDRVFATVDACFIATAAYGSRDDAQVVTLRRFRDDVLLTRAWGREAVDLYYAISPPIADAVRRSDLVRQAVRATLAPVVGLIQHFE